MLITANSILIDHRNPIDPVIMALFIAITDTINGILRYDYGELCLHIGDLGIYADNGTVLIRGGMPYQPIASFELASPTIITDIQDIIKCWTRHKDRLCL